jgi:hypothetical protein
MEKEDIYIKEALSILKENNSYFKKVYSSSTESPNSFNIMIGGDFYYFIMNIPSPTGDFSKILLDKITEIDNVDPDESIAIPGPSAMSGAKPIGETGKIYEKDDAIFLLSEIEKIASLKPVDTPDTPETVDTPKTPESVDTPKTPETVDTPSDKTYFIHKFAVRDRTEGATSKEFITSVTDRSLESFKLLLEYFGYLVDDYETIHTDTNPQDLFQYVPNNAITPKNIKPAPAAILKSYYIRFTWGETADRKSKTIHTVSTYWDKSIVENLFNERLMNKLTSDDKKLYKDLDIKVQEATDKSRYGSFDFNNIHPDLLKGSSIGLLNPQAYQIDCLDMEGDEHSFTTEKSKVSLDDYVHKLRTLGFNNVKAQPVNKSGKINIDDIKPGFQAKKSTGFFQRFKRK